MKEGSEHAANYNLVANLRKVFPAKHYYFNGNWMSSANDSREMNKFRSVRMLRIAMTGASESNNAPVSIRHWMRPGDQFIDIPIDLNETSLDRASDEITTIAVFVEARVGWCLRAWEEDTGCEFTLEVYVDKKNVVASRKSRKSRKRVKKSPAQPSESIVNVSSESSEAVGHLEIQKPLVKFEMGSFGKALVLTIVTILFVCLFCVGVFLKCHH